MGGIKLELCCPKSFHGIAVDPQPDWSLDALASELNALELKLNDSLYHPTPLVKTKIPEFSNSKENGSKCETFMMRVSYDEMEASESNDDYTGELSLRTGTRFSCTELGLSDSEDSEDEFDHETFENHLMDKTGQAEGILFESEREHRLRVQEEIWNRFSALEADLRNETERSVSTLTQVEEYIETRREMDRIVDKDYQRITAGAIESHLFVVKRDREQISQIEEQRIRNDAAFEEVKKKENAILEEKARQEKTKAEMEARLMVARAAEETRKAVLDSERKAREATEREAIENGQAVAVGVNEGDSQPAKMGSDESSNAQSAGIIVKAAESALRVERERLQKHKEVVETNHGLKLNSNKDFSGCERQIARLVKQISGTEESFRAKASALVKIINDPLVPQSVSLAMFAKQVVSLCENPSVSITATSFACGRIIVIVSSQVPVTMDLVLAEFHKACIYTIPKHIRYSESAFKTKEAYCKAIGYQEEDGKIESTAHYLERVESYMTLYAALVQTEINGIRNLHGLQEGWAWLARFLNTLPADLPTAVALLAFLRMSGFMMFRKYKCQFRKILNVISCEFLVALKKIRDLRLNQVIAEIETYIETNQFLQEPQGWRLQTSLLSKA